MENWFARDSEAMTKFIHETSRKQINVPKVLEFLWLRSENLTEARTFLNHQKLKHFLEITNHLGKTKTKLFPKLFLQMLRKIPLTTLDIQIPSLQNLIHLPKPEVESFLNV